MKIIHSLTIIAAVAFLFGCSLPEQDSDDRQKSTQTQQRFSTESAKTKKWTVMVYLSGDNNLHQAGINDINEMKQVGSSDEVNIVVLWDGNDTSTHGYYYIEKGTAVLKQDTGEVNMGDEAAAKAFIDYVTQKYPAEHYFIDFWNHGGGPDRSAAAVLTAAREVSKGICWDYSSADFLSDIELKNIMSYFKERIGMNIDIIGFDACLMASLEIAYQVCDSADYMIASEDDEPFEGWNYTFLQELHNNADMPADVLTNHIGNYYKEYYPGTAALTLSVFDLRKVYDLSERLDLFCKSAINSGIPGEQFKTVHEQTICFGTCLHDLGGYMETILTSEPLPVSIKQNASHVITAINDVILYEWHNGYNQTVTGISIVLQSDTPAYRLLDLCEDTQWNEFLTFCGFQ